MTATSKLRHPYELVESSWSVDNAPHWAFRTYLAQTLSGMLRTLVDAMEECQLRAGLLHVPSSIMPDLDWWPEELDGDDESRLVIWNAGKNRWEVLKRSFSNRTGLGQELWGVWVGDCGGALLAAHKVTPRRSVGLIPTPAWRLLLSGQTDHVSDAFQQLAPLFNEQKPLRDPVNQIEAALTQLSERESSPSPATVIRSALTLADHMDPWTREQLVESAWTKLYNRIQEGVGWEERVEHLMPSIGEIVEKTLGYDFFDLLIFSRVGKRYEEFLTWRRNRTGVGGKDINILLSTDLVEKVIEERKPRLIETTREDGLLNPHLAQLAKLKEGVVVPLVHKRRVHGIMTLYYRQPTGYQQKDLSKLSNIGRLLAMSIENTNAHENVRRMATVDALTGLHNRRSFMEQIAREMRRMQRYDQHFSLIMIDIDHFKHYNDTHGHLRGDHLLRRFARVLENSVREHDIVARYGGEEFAVILPHTKADAGLVVAEKIRKKVKNTKFDHADSQPMGFVSVSLGVTDTTDGAKNPKQMIDQADTALYAAKGKGRNRSMIYSPDLASHLTK